MYSKELIAEIEAVTDEEIEAAELNRETDGVRVGEPVTDRFLKQLATLYYREEDRRVDEDAYEDPDSLSTVERHQRFLHERKVSALGALLDLELERRYGSHISEAEREACTILEVRADWLVYKVLDDIPAEELQDQLDTLDSAPNRTVN